MYSENTIQRGRINRHQLLKKEILYQNQTSLELHIQVFVLIYQIEGDYRIAGKVWRALNLANWLSVGIGEI